MDAGHESGVLAGLVVGLGVGVLIGGLILKSAIKLMAKFSPGYGRVCLTVLVGSVMSFAISFLLSGATSGDMVDLSKPSSLMSTVGMVSGIVAMVVGFLINTVAVNWMVKRPDGSAMGFDRAALVVLFYMVIFLVLTVIAGVIAFAIFGPGIDNATPTQ